MVSWLCPSICLLMICKTVTNIMSPLCCVVAWAGLFELGWSRYLCARLVCWTEGGWRLPVSSLVTSATHFLAQVMLTLLSATPLCAQLAQNWCKSWPRNPPHMLVNSPILTLAAAKSYIKLWLLTLVQPQAVWGRRNPLLPGNSTGPVSPAGKELLWQHLPGPCAHGVTIRSPPAQKTKQHLPPLPVHLVQWSGWMWSWQDLCWLGQLPSQSSAPGQQYRWAQPEHPCLRCQAACVWDPCGACYGPNPLPKPCW